MKIALLTMVFNNNYGGILQAYALHRYLTDLGHEVTLINAQQKLPPLIQAPYSISKRLFLKYILKKDVDFIMPDWVYRKMRKIREANTRAFIDAYINPKTKTVYTNKGIRKVAKNFDCFIVGSDQVWRPTMYPFINSAFFGFVEDSRARKISYAASFGSDIWEYTTEQTDSFKKQVQLFDLVSVRESSGVALCKRNFNVDAFCLIDPTMLLEKGHYEELMGKEGESSSTGRPQMFCYFLDETEDKRQLLNLIARHKEYAVNRFPLLKNHSKSFIYPKVSLWLKGFRDADFVVTDSFHGCVFSIIFNKPFVAYGNVRRGLDRFTSLLNLFGLNNQLILSTKEFKVETLDEEIDWERINKIIKEEQEKTNRFFNLARL